jgi:peptidoglycan/LPS O-acetylase OafA/YrhL
MTDLIDAPHVRPAIDAPGPPRADAPGDAAPAPPDPGRRGTTTAADPTQPAARPPHWGGLDGLRAVAVIAVLGAHFGFLGQNSVAGVDLFFVISGFLITSLLVQERDRHGAVSLRQFWARRALRLCPALGCAIALALLVSLAASPAVRHQTVVGLPWVLLYVGNWARALTGGQALGLLGHTWSLAIEEQFYIVWPILVCVWVSRVARRRTAALVLGLLAVLDSVYFVWALHAWGASGFYRTDTHAMGLLAGCALALFVDQRVHGPAAPHRAERANASLQMVGGAGLALFGIVCIAPALGTTESAKMLVIATAASVLLVASMVLAPACGLSRAFAGRVPRWVGRRSYGIYLYHAPLAAVFVATPLVHGVAHSATAAGCIAASVALAAASYRWVELPFLRRKGRFNQATPTQPR